MTYYSKKELCSLLKVSISTIDRAIKSGELQATKIGEKCVRISEEAVNQWIEAKNQ